MRKGGEKERRKAKAEGTEPSRTGMEGITPAPVASSAQSQHASSTSKSTKGKELAPSDLIATSARGRRKAISLPPCLRFSAILQRERGLGVNPLAEKEVPCMYHLESTWPSTSTFRLETRASCR